MNMHVFLSGLVSVKLDIDVLKYCDSSYCSPISLFQDLLICFTLSLQSPFFTYLCLKLVGTLLFPSYSPNCKTNKVNLQPKD